MPNTPELYGCIDYVKLKDHYKVFTQNIMGSKSKNFIYLPRSM